MSFNGIGESYVDENLRIVVFIIVAQLRYWSFSKLISFLVLFILCHVIYAQSPESLRRKANMPETSLPEKHALFYQAWLLDSVDIQLRYELALISSDLGRHHEALYHFARIYQKDEGKIFPENLKLQAELYARLGMTDMAIDIYEKYLRRHKNSPCSHCVKDARAKLDDLKWFQKNHHSSLPFMQWINNKIDSLGVSQLLSKGLDDHQQMTFIGSNDHKMFFKQCDEDCYVSSAITSFRDSLEMNGLEPLPVHHKFCSFNGRLFSVIVNDNSFHFADDKGELLNDYPVFQFNSDEAKYSTPFLTEGNKLYFSSDRSGGFGGMDIWYTVLENGIWSEIKNLGKPYNTEGDEVFPVVHDSVLYFSSNGHKGFGGLDVYAVHPTDGKMIHLAEPVCSSADDVELHFQFSQEKGRLIWSSNRPANATSDACCYNIWFSDFHLKAEDIVSSMDSTVSSDFIASIEANPLQLYFHNDEPDPRSRVCKTSQDYLSCIDSYLSLRWNYMNVNPSGDDTLSLQKFFDHELHYSGRRIDTLAQCIRREMQSGHNAAIVVKGFASKRAAAQYNQCLSGRRISCFENTLRNWNDGVLKSYMDSGNLQIIAQPMGEDFLSDHREDDIYSYSSCLSRRIEIMQMLTGNGDILCNSSVSLRADNLERPLYFMNISDRMMQLKPIGLPENVIMAESLSLPPGELVTAWIRNTRIDSSAQGVSLKNVEFVTMDGSVKAQVRLKIHPQP